MAWSTFVSTVGATNFTINFEAPLLHPTIGELTLRAVMEGAAEQVLSQTPNVCDQLKT